MPSPELPVTLAWLKGDALEPVGCVSALDHLHLLRVVVVARRGRELGDLVRGEQNVIGGAVSSTLGRAREYKRACSNWS